MLGIISAKVTAAPGSSGWAQVHDFSPDDPEKLRLRGRLIAVLATSRVQEGIDTITSGRELIGRLHEEYFGTLEGKPFDVLRTAVQRVTEEFRESWGDIEIAACAFVDGVVFSVAAGGGKVIICREGALATILESSGEVIAASGYPKEGDLILLATRTFFEKVPSEMIKEALTSGSPESAAEVFAPVVHGEREVGNIGAAIIKFDGTSNLFSVQKPPQPISPSVVAPTIGQKITGLINKFKRNIPERNIYIKSGVGDEVSSNSRKVTFSAGIVLLVILIVSISFGIRQKNINDLKKKYQGNPSYCPE